MPKSKKVRFWDNTQHGYHAVAEPEANAHGGGPYSSSVVSRWTSRLLQQHDSFGDHVQRIWGLFLWACFIFSMFLGLVLSALTILAWPSGDQPKRCVNPGVRREWRSLTLEERTGFISAVNCLSRVPSVWDRNGTIYDDFAELHGGIGSCYWDWTADWADLAASSIWSPETGFGGDGNRSGPVTVGEGRCVTDGPFSELRPIKYNHTYGQDLRRSFRPESIGKIMRMRTYSDFAHELEYRLHNSLHYLVSGDFRALTAANDPIFYVHHAQMDHLWWRWQQEDPEVRQMQYQGKHMFNSTRENATVEDMLHYGGFVDDIHVSQVMDTQNGHLCYRY
ncbi:Di-copper centre-containing protein [Apiospora aurea]|uniref:Di-copper centre-containing protein n=1 Tax=Apiospora aurea TaxID=335848 RepID=A0ABR1QG16_9PEZI